MALPMFDFLFLLCCHFLATTVVYAIAEPRVTSHNGSLVLVVDVERDVNIILRSNGIETQSLSLLNLFQTVDALKRQMESMTINLVGPPGPKGDQGLQGSRGERGSPGLQGERGLEGSIGPAGSRGLTGSPGVRGIPGIPGIRGIAGRTGATGSRGDTGPTGPSGVTRITTSCYSGASSCQFAGGRNLEYLDRQSISCRSGYVLKSFDYTASGCGGNDRRFTFVCCYFYPY